MKKRNKILKSFAFPLAMASLLCAGGFLINNINSETTLKSCSADFSVLDNLENQVPDYLQVVPQDEASNKLSYANDNLFLFQTEQYFDLKIATDTISTEIRNPITDIMETKTNYVYFPQATSKQSYYYFDFQTSLSLYYNLTGEDIASGLTSENIIKNQNISNYASSNDNGFTPNDTSFTPQQFDIQFKLNLLEEETLFENKTVTLTKEGCYTLVIPVVEYYTNNGGASFSANEKNIYYTFMAFNANTYFDSTSGKPKLIPSENLNQTLLGSASSEFSSYYYYNFAYGKNNKVNTLPEISYNPNHYQLKIEYTDIDTQTHTAYIQYQNQTLVQLDEKGNNIEDEFIKVRKNADGTATVIFYDIGSYDINLTYLYTLTNSNGSTTYYLPFENLKNNNIFKNKAQRLYIYGYQAVYSDYANKNPETKQPESVDLKTYDFEKGIYENSADITSLINHKAGLTNLTQSANFNDNEITYNGTDYPKFAEGIKAIIDGEQIKPISTNQTPIKFLTNATNSAVSEIYTQTWVDNDGDGKKETSVWTRDDEGFKGFNENKAGTYLYIIQYNFESYMSSSGALQSSYYHYQIFYFTVTNSSPTVDVIEMSDDYNEVYTNGYTNKSVYILNNAQNNNYDAEVKITLSAKNYKTGSYYFQDENIKNLSKYGFNYQQFAKNTAEADNSVYNSKIANKHGLLIENTNKYANAEFTIKITSPMSNKPSTRRFTIDTNAIANIETRNVAVQTSTTYRISNNFDGFATNTPFIFSWDEKASGAKTFGYVKYIPTTSINYYSSLDENNLAELLARLIDSHDTLPVSYKIDMESAKTSTWTEYKNSQNHTSSVPSTYVKSNDGFYILEVYDQAGNVSFDIFLLDSSAPIFIEELSGDTTIQKILSKSESLSVPENDVDVTIKWTSNKAIYLENMTTDILKDVKAYQYGVDVENANNVLQEKINAFFTLSNSNISYFNDITAQTTELTGNPALDDDKVPTGISSFNGNYLIIPIDKRVYIKEGTSSTFAPFNTNSYEIEFFDENGELIADNTTYKILIRDGSNTISTANEAVNFKNHPSGHISFNVTSDASKLMLIAEGEMLDFSTYSLNGLLYSYLDADGHLVYTHIADEEAVNEEGEPIYTQTDLGYKFSYYTPINSKKEVQISYIPVADNGSKLQSIELKYYPFQLKNIEKDGNNYFYYDIAQDPTKIVNVFTKSDKTYDQGDIVTFDVAFGTDNYPLAGKYVIERIYSMDSLTDKYDYYKRILTFTVDNFNLISPLEKVTDGEHSSLESVVGGDIVLSMYSGVGNSSIQVSFPTYNEHGLNSGSFYTKDSFTDKYENISFAVEGNKLPMSIFIPRHKYTVSNSKLVDGGDGVYYSVNKNDNLSYYGNAQYNYNEETNLYEVYIEGVLVETFGTEKQAQNYINNLASIIEYQIYAEIKATVRENNREVVKYYYSNDYSTNGYLNFYLADGENGKLDTSKPVENFYLQGDYVVTIYQANNIGETNNFYTFYKFGFKIKSQAPDFDVIGKNGYELTNTNTPNTYYTNSSELKIQWEVTSSEFDAKIDESNIIIRPSISSAYTYRGIIHNETTSKYFTIDTTDLVKRDGSFIEITMQYEGHNNLYYSKITKRIYFDKSAPTQNLQSLMTLTENATSRAFTKNYQLMYMRKYADFDGNEVTLTNINDILNVSYVYSIDTGYFKYFSYNVTTDYFNRVLLQTIQSANSNAYDTQYVYYKKIDNIDTYTQVDSASFSSGNYYYITADRTPNVTCGYYEIVEMDYAGNMTVYLVYLIDSTSSSDSNVRTDAISYANRKTIEDVVINDNEISNGFNIYSTSDFELMSLNYKSDPWALLSVQIAGKSETRYLKSPWLNDSQIYQITFGSSGINFNQVSLKSIFENVESSANKHKLTFTDRTLGLNQIVYLSVMDASLSPEKVEDPSRTSAILNIDIPTSAQVQSTTTTYVYPTNIVIYQYDTTVVGADNWQIIMEANQGPYGTWTPTDEFLSALNFISFSHLAGGKTLQIKTNLGANATQKVKYVITDNFGNTSTVIQLANEVGYKEISGSSIIYTAFENDGSTTYLSDQTIKYSYNTLLYSIEIYDRNALDITGSIPPDFNPLTNISVINFAPTGIYCDDYYKIKVWDIESDSDEPLKTIHIRLYNKLPFRTNQPNDVADGGIIFNDKNQQPIDEANIGTIPSLTVTHDGKTYSSSAEIITTFSQNVTLRFKDGQSLAFEGAHSYQNGYSYSVLISSDDGWTWQNINSANSDTSGYTLSGVGEYIVLIKYDSEEYFTNLCKLFVVSILDSSASYYYITVDGLAVEKNDVKYTSLDNREYDVNYIVSVDYADKNNRLNITANEELNVIITRIGVDNTGSLVTVEIYHYECTESVGDFTIIYIAETKNIVNVLTYETASGSTTSIKDLSSDIVVANNETEPNFSKLKINFSSFYGIETNKIKVQVFKLFNNAYINIDNTIYTSGDNSYIYLESAGSYRIKFYDSCSPANIQAFKNSQYFDMIFLSHVPFIVTRTDIDGFETITEPVQKAVYNGTVKIKPINLSDYYQASGYPTISVKLNGHDYKGYDVNNRVYTFTTPGYYSVKFSAKSTTGIQVREEEFNFTIINPNESREAYEFTKYEQYYIEKVFKNGIDVTEDLISMTNFDTVIIDGKKYLSTISISYLDNKTGEGKYTIVINHNKTGLANVIGRIFAFSLWINHVETVPITVSTADGILKQGDKTSKDIIISFNVQNLYEAVGDCYIKVGDKVVKYYTAESIKNAGKVNQITITESGTYFVQVYTTGGKLLYSYKIVKTEPLNAFAVLAIVIGVIAAAVVVFITIRLRKRQRVK